MKLPNEARSHLFCGSVDPKTIIATNLIAQSLCAELLAMHRKSLALTVSNLFRIFKAALPFIGGLGPCRQHLSRC